MGFDLILSRYNSAVFRSITANEYYVSSNFFDGVPWNRTAIMPTSIGYGWMISSDDINHQLDNFQRKVTKTERMATNASVIAMYNNAYLTNRAGLLMASFDSL